MRQMKFCPNCGSPIVKSNRFCTKCGIKFEIFLSDAAEQSLQSPEYFQSEAQEQAHSNSSPAADHQKSWESTSQTKPKVDSVDRQHNVSTIEKKSGTPEGSEVPPIRNQIDKFLEDLLKQK
jgi:uncharacterized Zn finger protein (UPF0148 family)